MNKTLKGLTSFVSAALLSLCIGCGHPTNKVAISPRGKIAYSVDESSNHFIPSEDSSKLVVSNRFGEVEEIIEGGYWPDFNKKGELLYLKGDEDNNNLFAEEENLTNTENITYGTPSWKPDGSRIVFVSNRDNKSQEQLSDLEKLEIYEISSENKEFRRITDNNEPEAFPVYSPDGKHIAFLRGIKKKLPETLSRILDSEEGIELCIDLLVMDENGNNQKTVENPSLGFIGDLGAANYNFLDRLFSWHRDYVVYTSFEKVVKSIEKRLEGMSKPEFDKLSELEKNKLILDCLSSIEIARYNPKTGKAEFLTRNKVPDLGAIVFGDTLAYISFDEREYEKAKKEFKLISNEEQASERAFILASQIATYTMDINGRNMRRISKQGEASIPMAWMPDGKLVMMAIDKGYLKFEDTEPSDIRIILQDLETGERVDISTPVNIQLKYVDAFEEIQESIQERIEKLEKSAQEAGKLIEKPKEEPIITEEENEAQE